MRLTEKVRRALKEGGLKLVILRGIRLFYGKLSRILPQRYGLYNGVRVPSHRFLGTIIDNEESIKPDYEEGIINSMKENIEKGDKIVILGGGLGVTAVTAAKMTESPEKVTVYEGSAKQISKIERTLETNNVDGVQVKHAVVGPEIDVWGSSKNAAKITPEELPECDVLEMDIEGSEIEVLENLEIRPRVIIVESHGEKGSPTSEVKNLLREHSYHIKDIEYADNSEYARENDIQVITGIREE